jgi:inorganic pyrophosphatase
MPGEPVVFVEIPAGSRNKYEFDEKGPDEKLLCVPRGDPAFERIKDIHDVAGELRDEIEHFFQRYKDLEPSKQTETRGWGNRSEAETILAAARERKDA